MVVKGHGVVLGRQGQVSLGLDDYLSDFRKTGPSKLRTILRQPVTEARLGLVSHASPSSERVRCPTEARDDGEHDR